jgi:hypothetical protein
MSFEVEKLKFNAASFKVFNFFIVEVKLLFSKILVKLIVNDIIFCSLKYSKLCMMKLFEALVDKLKLGQLR